MPRARFHAFTLIETLAAMMLATLLMLAGLDVLRTLPRIPASNSQPAIFQDAMMLLRWDLLNARRFQVDGDRLTLWGMNSLDPVNLAPTHRPTRVTYRIEPFAGAVSLMRLQQAMSGDGAGWTQVVCANIAAISLRSIPDSTAAPGDAEPFDRNQGSPLSRCVEIGITSDSGAITQTLICLR